MQYTNVTDRQTEGQTDTRETAKTALTTVKLDRARYSCILFVRLHLPHHTHSSSASTSDFFSLVSFFLAPINLYEMPKSHLYIKFSEKFATFTTDTWLHACGK